MRQLIPLTLLPLVVSTLAMATFGLPSGSVRAAAARPAIAFEPDELEMDSSSYDRPGTLSYADDKDVTPEPVPPQKGYLECNDGYTVALKVTAGPYDQGRIADHYDVLAESVTPFVPPKGTDLKCSSEWGLYSTAKKKFIGTSTLYVTIAYDTGIEALQFKPAAVSLTAGSGPYSGTLAYDAHASEIEPIPDPGGYLDCTNGTTVPLHVKAGPESDGIVEDSYTIDPSGTSVAAGSTLDCTSTWGAYTKGGQLLGKGTLTLTLSGSSAHAVRRTFGYRPARR